MSRRPSGIREPKKRILFVVEGKTECNYLDGLKERDVNIEIVIIKSKRKSAPQIVKECAVNVKERHIDIPGGDVAYAVFDLDENSHEAFEKACNIAAKNRIQIIISNPCFETWLLLHFQHKRVPGVDKEWVESSLTEYIKEYDKAEKYNNILSPLRQTAVDNSKRIASDCHLREPMDFYKTNYSTNMHGLIEHINKEKTKERMRQFYDGGMINNVDVGTTDGLVQIHRFLFKGLPFSGEIRNKNISIGGLRFTDASNLRDALNNIDKMPESSCKEIIGKYIKMNIARPFINDNGISIRIWLDLMLKRNLHKCVDWRRIDEHEYLAAIGNSATDSTAIVKLLAESLTDNICDREIFMKGLERSYYEKPNGDV
jgi:Protein involved in cell division